MTEKQLLTLYQYLEPETIAAVLLDILTGRHHHESKAARAAADAWYSSYATTEARRRFNDAYSQKLIDDLKKH